MTINSFSEVDYLTETLGRVTEQFKGKPIYAAFINIVMQQILELQQAFKDLKQLRSIDTASGEQLDVIGRLVGQERTLVNYDVFPYFGFNGATGAETFGTVTDPAIGGVFKSYLQQEGSSATVDDETYRFLIKARIIANTTKATPEAVISGLNFITSNANCSVIEQPNAHITLEIQDNLTDFQKYFLQGLSNQGSIVPIPIGVAVDYVYFNENYFGFNEDSNANGFAKATGGYGFSYGSSYGSFTTSGGGYLSQIV